MKTCTAYVGLGANLGEPLQQLRSAVAALVALPGCTLAGISRLYGSAPIGPQDQPDYLNAVARLDTQLTPHALLGQLQAIENEHGRVRARHWGERTLDLDLLLFGNDRIHTRDLIVPHPEMLNRAFVLRPLMDLDPGIMLADNRKIADFVDDTREQPLHVLMGQSWWKPVD